MDGLDNFLRIDGVRHGDTLYTQREVPLEDADDLTVRGKIEVVRSAQELSGNISQEMLDRRYLSIEINSSPYGRALHSARITRDVFRGFGIPFREDDEFPDGVRVVDELGPIRGVSDWGLVIPLAEGGEVRHNGESFYIDRERTNPNGYGLHEYLFKEAFRKLGLDVRESFPEEYVREINRMERIIQCAGRLARVMRTYEGNDRPTHAILATHSELLYYPANVFTRGVVNLVGGGEYVSFDRKDGKFVVTGVGDLMEGRTNLGILDALDADYAFMSSGDESMFLRD